MPDARPERATVRREVLRAAREVFAEYGYHRASLDVIAARAGFTKGAVYSNFAGKDDLFLALLALEATEMSRSVGSAALSESGPGVRDPLTALASGLARLAADGRAQIVYAEFRATASRDPVLAAHVASAREDLVDQTAERLEDAVASLGLTLLVPAHEAASIIFALTNGLALEQIGRTDAVVGTSTLVAVLQGLFRPLA